ncbi:MAG: hypothetical protein RLZZ598_746, partial [Pseudomonadota bacterium]
GLAALSGLASYVRLGEQLDAAAADPTVRGILLDLDSNGGQAGGVFDLAGRILALRGIKPVYAIADEAALSAAYALACGAERLYVTQTGAVGSIGVVAVHVDQSAADQQAGLRYDYITAGEHKADGHPHAPLSEGARTALQAEVDRLYGLFAAHVAKARALPETVVRDQQAGVYFGANAVDAGLADQVGTFATVLADLSARIAPRRTAGRGGSLPLTAQKGPFPMSEALPAETAAVTEASLRKQLAAEIEITAETNAAVPEDPRAMAQRLRAEAAEILDLCRLAGHPALAAEFVRQGRTPAVVRKALLAGRAEQFEAAPTMPIDPTAAVGENPLIAAIKAAYPKER